MLYGVFGGFYPIAKHLIMEQYEILKKLINALIQSENQHSLLVIGKPGIGKTSTTLATMEQLGFKEGENYLYWNNYITPMEFYNLLQEVNELENPKILILDDIEETLKSQRILGLLKGALWSVGNRRIVSWLSGTSKIKESRIDFKGKIIFILNYLQLQNPFIQAVIDRSFFYEMKLKKCEMIEMMKKEIEKPQYQISRKQKNKILNIIQQIDEKKLSLRTLQQLYNLCLTTPAHFEKVAQKIYFNN